ncbi:MAG: 4'-phosphopantetheinyl transferase family protein [Nesterenkonia sp.]
MEALDGVGQFWLAGALVQWGQVKELNQQHGYLLTTCEHQYANRYRFSADRQRSTAGMALLRLTLAELTGADPALTTIHRWCRICGGRDHGRPMAKANTGVSISHAENVAMAAVHPSKSIGADLEPADRQLSADLTMSLTSHNDPNREGCPSNPLRLWVRKEALLKATGEGLGTSPDRVWVSRSDEPAAFVRHTGLAGLQAEIHDVPMGPNLVGAIALVE